MRFKTSETIEPRALSASSPCLLPKPQLPPSHSFLDIQVARFVTLTRNSAFVEAWNLKSLSRAPGTETLAPCTATAINIIVQMVSAIRLI
jgi:hypothetical protein